MQCLSERLNIIGGNFLTCLQESVLRVVPGTHWDYTEVNGGYGLAKLDHISSLDFSDRPELSSRVLPHPREACVPIRTGQVMSAGPSLGIEGGPRWVQAYMHIRRLPSLGWGTVVRFGL